MSTVLVLLGLCLLAAGAIAVMRREKKKGKSSCGGSCASCGACGACRGCRAEGKEKQAG